MLSASVCDPRHGPAPGRLVALLDRFGVIVTMVIVAASWVALWFAAGAILPGSA
jgi:hypothetical protein